MTYDEMSPEERLLVECAIGRVLRLGSRPEQPGDIEQYEEARARILSLCDDQPGWEPNYARDRNLGAPGD